MSPQLAGSKAMSAESQRQTRKNTAPPNKIQKATFSLLPEINPSPYKMFCMPPIPLADQFPLAHARRPV